MFAVDEQFFCVSNNFIDIFCFSVLTNSLKALLLKAVEKENCVLATMLQNMTD